MVEWFKDIMYTFALGVVSFFHLGESAVNLVYVFLISLLPIIELRGAIPVAYALGVKMLPAFLVAVLSNLIPVPFIIWLLVPVCRLLKKTKLLAWFPLWMEKKVEKNRTKVEKYKKWGLFIFVAIPLPGTGAWTGAVLASFLDFKFKDAFVSILFGVLCAGVIVTALTYGAFDFIVSLF